MQIYQDDVIKKTPVSGQRGVISYYVEGTFSPDRVLTIRFHQKEIVVYEDGELVEKPMPKTVSITLSDPAMEYPLYHRRTGADTGNTFNGGRVTQILTSLYYKAVADAVAEEAAAAARLAEEAAKLAPNSN